MRYDSYRMTDTLLSLIPFKYRDLVNLFSSFFTYFDPNECQWKLENQQPCPTTTTTTTTTTTSTRTTTTTIATTSVTTPVPTDSTTTVAETTSLKPMQFCNDLDSSWMCSLENEQHSLCIKFCSKNDVTSYKRCVCRHSECTWSQKGQKCPEDIPDPLPGNPFSNSNYDLAALTSIMKEINIANHGHIHVKFNL